MSFQTDLSSNTFNIEHTSKEIDFQKHFHKREMQIIKQNQPRKVVFGRMEEEEQSVYEIVSPYVTSMARTTGSFAYETGSMAYEYLKQGFWWFYDQITNKVIPYTREEIPKLIFIIAKSGRTENSIKSGEFCVLEMQDQDYKEIAKKQRQGQGPIKVLIPLGNKDEALIQQIKRNHQVSYSFPIDDLDGNSQKMSVTYCIPSQSYQIIEEEAKSALRVERSRAVDITQLVEEKREEKKEVEQKTVKVDQEQKQACLNNNRLEQKPQDLIKSSVRKSSLSQEEEWQEVKGSFIKQTKQTNQKPKPKAIFLPDACCFIYEQEDELYPFIKERLDQDSNAVVGHLMSSEQFMRKGSRDSSEGEVPLVTVEQRIGKAIEVKREVEVKEVEVKQEVEVKEVEVKERKVVDMERRVRPQIGPNLSINQNQRVKNYEMQLN